MSWLKRIFGKKDTKDTDTNSRFPVEHSGYDKTQISFADVQQIILEGIADSESKALDECLPLRSRIIQIVDELRNAVDALAGMNVPEPKAASSKTIKDGFCQRALVALERINIIQWNSVVNAQNNLVEAERLLAAVSVGPSEAMHVKFFFDEQMSAIATLLHSAFDTIGNIRDQLAPAAKKRKRAEKLFSEIETSERLISAKISEIEELHRKINDAKTIISGVKFYDLTELQRLRDEFLQHRKTISDIEQQISSAISPANRLLKRFGHSADRHTDEFIQLLDSRPAGTFCESEERVKAVLASALSSVKSGNISADEKEIRRAEDMMRRFDDISGLHSRRDEVLHKINELQVLIENEVGKERANSVAADNIRSMESVIAESELRIVELKREVAEHQKQSSESKRMLADSFQISESRLN